jgi:hypothetical protein
VLTVYRRIFGVLAFLAVVDWTARNVELGGGKTLYALIAVWLAGSILLFFPRLARLGSVLMVPSALAIVFLSNGELFSQHVYLLVTIAAILGFARESEVSLLFKITLTLCYGFSAISKLNESFLSGDVIYQGAVMKPLWQFLQLPMPNVTVLIVLSVIAACTEAFLTFAFWSSRLRWVGLVIGAGFHLVMLLFVGATDPVHFNRLLLFALIMGLLYIPFFLDPLRVYAARVRARFFARRARATETAA